MNNWNIESETKFSKEQRERYWSNVHSADYKSVFSVTQDQAVLDGMIEDLKSIIPSPKKVLIPGCGSKVHLQERLHVEFPKLSQVCIDFKEVVDVAAKRLQFPEIDFIGGNFLDVENIGNDFDAALIVNSILSEDHAENCSLVEKIFASLRPGGVLIGLFPTILATIDIAWIEGTPSERIHQVDLSRSAFYERQQQLWQIFYTPLRLRRLLLSVGFEKLKMEIMFLDSEYFKEHTKEYYGISEPEVFIYELLTIALKPMNISEY